VLVGVVLLATRQANPVDLVTRAALDVHLPLTSELFEKAVSAALNLTVARETALAVTAFGYAALLGAEGLALYWRKPWARWFTIIVTASLLPVEAYEIVRSVSLVRVLVLLANLAVVGYLWRRPGSFRPESVTLGRLQS
jgi:uncharacterized membrane protein (DUF2068 family)